ncbi:MAG: hypothetical protein GAK30_01583 [Paracidovorax wautersii]|uniref:P2 phage tail completion protein R (GpR) n=1 Tax=Paracidovorax wautersii TaxID=1177982 RepID=A0A7V8JR00_9BURK|nr:MAG: hypothetical protein GAK30_01583 [Paracidovorax wautersii]
MKKPALIRELLEKAIPNLATNPERLSIFVEHGGITSTGTPSLSFEYRYTVIIGLVDFNDSPDVAIVPLVAWIKTNQPDLFTNPATADKAFRFEAEILNHQTANIEIQIDLSESIRVTGQTIDGVNRLQTYHVGEPTLALPGHVAEMVDLDAEWHVTPISEPPA